MDKLTEANLRMECLGFAVQLFCKTATEKITSDVIKDAQAMYDFIAPAPPVPAQ